MVVKGYKVFMGDWTCRDKQYSCPGEFEEDVELELCHRGMHFCKRLKDCFKFYTYRDSLHVAEVEAFGDVITDEDDFTSKCCTNKLRIIRELSKDEIYPEINNGWHNCGYDNDGTDNSGDNNSGRENIGSFNFGMTNKGENNYGSRNQGHSNMGCSNCGSLCIGSNNIGAGNIGLENIGNDNIGRYNFGSRNYGSKNVGERNFGMWNRGNNNFGYFCIGDNMPGNMWFNKPAANFNVAQVMYALQFLDNFLPVVPQEQFAAISERIKNDELWQAHVDCEIHYSDKSIIKDNEKNWAYGGKEGHNSLFQLPNFNPEIFEKLTGIDTKNEFTAFVRSKAI